jgi:GAF domain-containing protein
MVDDPNDALIPSPEEIHTLEILANQISIAIENRLAYLQIQERLRTTGNKSAEVNRDRSESGIKKLVDYFFK